MAKHAFKELWTGQRLWGVVEQPRTNQIYLKFLVHENEVGNSVTRAKHALSNVEGAQRRQEQQIRSTKSETNPNAQKSENSKPGASD